MEQAFLISGLTVGGILVFPLAMEWARKFQSALITLTVLFIGLHLIAPHSTSARQILFGLNRIPETVSEALTSSSGNLEKLGSEYYNAFHG